MEIIIAILIIWLCWPLITRFFGWLAQKLLMRYVSKVAGDPYSHRDNYSSNDTRRQGRAKGFSATEGEYVEFEEISAEREMPTADPMEYSGEQISDASYEEII